jgi:hypoxanthine-DNA glycosylase
MSEKTTRCYSFPPIEHADAKILILGSMPGAESLRQQQYYAHPRNAFWPIMAALFDLETGWDYQKQCAHLSSCRIAVWDVLKACHRPGSLDQHIEPGSMEANDFRIFLTGHPHIRHVFFNGAKAEQVFTRFVLPSLSSVQQAIPRTRLPSTSPAHAAMNFEQKLAAWQRAIEAVLKP